jgi:RHH-type rel operon transcriptional repressor/antitoxin RelB
MPTSVRLPEQLEQRLDHLAISSGRTRAYYIREAVERHLEDMEDLQAAEEVMGRIQRGEEATYPLAEVVKRLGLDD